MKLGSRIKKKEILSILLISGILIVSVGFLDYKKSDYNHEKEVFSISKEIVRIVNGINHFSPESKYIQVAEIAKKWPEIPLPDETGYNQLFEIKKISPENHNSLINYIQDSKKEGLTHLVVDGNEIKAKFLNEVFTNDKKYPFLIKEFDSLEESYNYHLKVYKIDYEKFEEFLEKNNL